MTATRPKFVRPVYVLGGYDASQRELARCTSGISAWAQCGQLGCVVGLAECDWGDLLRFGGVRGDQKVEEQGAVTR